MLRVRRGAVPKLGALMAIAVVGYLALGGRFLVDNSAESSSEILRSTTTDRTRDAAMNSSNLFSTETEQLSDMDDAKKSEESEGQEEGEEEEELETTTVERNTTLPLCPELEELPMLGPLPMALLLIEDLKENEVISQNRGVKPGGRWAPQNCKARHKIAIIVPYRDRQSHLTRLIAFLMPILRRQLLDFRFIVTEQFGNDLFNKGRIMNAAFEYANHLGVDCVIFHDVDMFPQDDRAPYGCPTTPRHLGAFVSNLGYQLWYKEIVGGALAISMSDYQAVNGYSNTYWAWGGEDDDMGKRMLSRNMTIERPPAETSRYSMLKHVKRKRTAPKLIYKMLETADTRWPTDGLNETGCWRVLKITKRPLYYHIFVDVGEPPKEWRPES